MGNDCHLAHHDLVNICSWITMIYTDVILYQWLAHAHMQSNNILLCQLLLLDVYIFRCDNLDLTLELIYISF